MPSSVVKEFGMLSLHPHKDELTNCLIEAMEVTIDWCRYFSSYYFVKEKESHYHIEFMTRYEYVGIKRERFREMILNEITHYVANKEFINPKRALVISYPKREDETFIKGVGYLMKGLINISQKYRLIRHHDIPESILDQARHSANVNTNTIDVVSQRQLPNILIRLIRGNPEADSTQIIRLFNTDHLFVGNPTIFDYVLRQAFIHVSSSPL